MMRVAMRLSASWRDNGFGGGAEATIGLVGDAEGGEEDVGNETLKPECL